MGNCPKGTLMTADMTMTNVRMIDIVLHVGTMGFATSFGEHKFSAQQTTECWWLYMPSQNINMGASTLQNMQEPVHMLQLQRFTC
jgi:hypothetical protein